MFSRVTFTCCIKWKHVNGRSLILTHKFGHNTTDNCNNMDTSLRLMYRFVSNSRVVSPPSPLPSPLGTTFPHTEDTTQRINLNIDGSPIVSYTHTHLSHSQTGSQNSRLLFTSVAHWHPFLYISPRSCVIRYNTSKDSPKKNYLFFCYNSGKLSIQWLSPVDCTCRLDFWYKKRYPWSVIPRRVMKIRKPDPYPRLYK